ncbi:dr1-associated corepressor-like [Asterias rubens]|uniref:dr1-associated corepressor-like n=1 Tax=Asterias rubens TaxID=7604 RepID=UPI0014559760|nr:dr1-associated corepressor-like [Asterias rubens]
MPRKKKKYNARFPPARIKKIMQLDEDVGKVAAAVPVVISKALEIFVESLLTKSLQQTQARSAKTMSTSHIKQCIESEGTFDFLKDLVENVPDMPCEEEDGPQPPTVHPTERKHRQHNKPRRKRSKDEGAGPSNSQLKQSSEEQSTSEDDSDTEEDEGTYNSDGNNMQDPLASAVATAEIPSPACVPGMHPAQSTSPPTLPMPPIPVFQPPTAAMGTVHMGMGMYQAPKNNSTDDDENYDT